MNFEHKFPIESELRMCLKTWKTRLHIQALDIKHCKTLFTSRLIEHLHKLHVVINYSTTINRICYIQVIYWCHAYPYQLPSAKHATLVNLHLPCTLHAVFNKYQDFLPMCKVFLLIRHRLDVHTNERLAGAS